MCCIPGSGNKAELCAVGRHAQAAALSEQLLSLRRVLSQIVQSRFLPEDLSTGQAGGPGGRSAAGGASKPGTASASAARAYLMHAAGELAAFLGEELAMTTLVPMFMYLPNEADWRVRAAFYHHLPEVTGTVVRPPPPISHAPLGFSAYCIRRGSIHPHWPGPRDCRVHTLMHCPQPDVCRGGRVVDSAPFSQCPRGVNVSRTLCRGAPR